MPGAVRRKLRGRSWRTIRRVPTAERIGLPTTKRKDSDDTRSQYHQTKSGNRSCVVHEPRKVFRPVRFLKGFGYVSYPTSHRQSNSARGYSRTLCLSISYRGDAGAEAKIFMALCTVWVSPQAVGKTTMAHATATRMGEDLVGTWAAMTLSLKCLSVQPQRTLREPCLSTSIFH